MIHEEAMSSSKPEPEMAGREIPASRQDCRAVWNTPSLRVLPAKDAEVGVGVTAPDGAFTTS
jgi:hypothetical protein